MEKYKIGTVFELYKENSQEYVIINNIEKEKNIYLLVVPINKEGETTKGAYQKIILLNVDKNTDNIEIETDENIIAEVVEDSIKKIEKQKK